MWQFVACAIISISALMAAQRDVLIFYRYSAAHDAGSLASMQSELNEIMRHSGVRVEWKEEPRVSPPATSSEIVVLRLKGQCAMDGGGKVPSMGPGALAVTHMVDGEILPFSDVDCNRVRSVVRSAMHNDDLVRADELFGRALGRVVAHELHHILSKSTAHGRRGVMRSWLSGQELIGEHLDVAPEDLAREASGEVAPSAPSRGAAPTAHPASGSDSVDGDGLGAGAEFGNSFRHR